MTGGAPSKLARIGTVRKNIARVLTVLNQQKKAEIRSVLKEQKAKYWPKELRAKKTRAMRRALSTSEVSNECFVGVQERLSRINDIYLSE